MELSQIFPVPLSAAEDFHHQRKVQRAYQYDKIRSMSEFDLFIGRTYTVHFQLQSLKRSNTGMQQPTKSILHVNNSFPIICRCLCPSVKITTCLYTETDFAFILTENEVRSLQEKSSEMLQKILLPQRGQLLGFKRPKTHVARPT